MRSKTIVIIFLCCILLGVAFFVNKDLFLKKEVPFDDVKELEMAYQWAYQAEITSQPTIEQANLNWYVTRAQLAKMMSNFSSNVLHKFPDTSASCEFDDIDSADPHLQLGIKQACQFWLMGQNVKKFRPSDSVTLWEFSVILTRAIWWDEFYWWDPYYKKSLKVLHKLWIVDDISAPLVDQKRWWIMLMLKRSNDLISKWEKEVADLIYRDYFVADYDLLDWNTIPALWFSTWALDNQQAENLVYAALKIW